MKIAINCRLWWSGYLEGIGHFAQEVIRRWLESHPEDEFHLIFDRSNAFDFSNLSHVYVHTLRPPARHPLLYHLWFEYLLPFRMRRIQPDVFFSPEALTSTKIKVPSIITIHDLAYMHFPESMLLRELHYLQKNTHKFIQSASGVATVSEFSKRDIEEQFPGLDIPVRVAYNGCRSIFQPLSGYEIDSFRAQHTQGRAYIFYYGSLNPRKNITRLMRAYEIFRKECAKEPLLVLGGKKGWKTQEMQSVYEEHPYREDILFTGYLDDLALKDWLGAASALAYVSLFEGFGLPVLEAMQAGVPVLTSRNSSMEEIAGEAAFYADPADISSIGAALQELFRDSQARKEKIETGIIRARKFQWDHTADVLYQFLQEVAADT